MHQHRAVGRERNYGRPLLKGLPLLHYSPNLVEKGSSPKIASTILRYPPPRLDAPKTSHIVEGRGTPALRFLPLFTTVVEAATSSVRPLFTEVGVPSYLLHPRPSHRPRIVLSQQDTETQSSLSCTIETSVLVVGASLMLGIGP